MKKRKKRETMEDKRKREMQVGIVYDCRGQGERERTE